MRYLLIAFGIVDLLLTLALVFRPIYYIGVSTGTATLGVMPDSAIRSLALEYVQTFDTFTPATIDANSRHLQTLVAPSHYHVVAEILTRRQTLVTQGQISSMVVLDPAISVQGPTAHLTGTKRIFLSDKLSSEFKVEYWITVHDLKISGQRTHEVRLD